jgi:RHS repeat-associated protein
VNDASGDLLLATDPATATTPAAAALFLDGGTEQITRTAALGGTAADTVATRFYPGPDGTAVTRSYDNGAAAAALTGQPGTPQGTATESVTGNASQVITRRYYDPYGNPAGSPVSWPDDLGYAGRPADAVSGLDLLGARQYDPVTGRFLSLDPLFEAGRPQDMGGVQLRRR